MSNHKYAYHVVVFKCCTCGAIESIWNSADVELPVGIPCRICQRSGKPINPNQGMLKPTERTIHNPEYLPSRGERVIIDLTPAMSLLQNKMKVKAMWNKEVPGRQKMCDTFKTPYEAVLEMQKSYQPNKPFVITL